MELSKKIKGDKQDLCLIKNSFGFVKIQVKVVTRNLFRLQIDKEIFKIMIYWKIINHFDLDWNYILNMLQHKSINLVPVQQQNYTWVTERVTFLQEENTKKYEHIQMEVQELMVTWKTAIYLGIWLFSWILVKTCINNEIISEDSKGGLNQILTK